MFDQPERFFDLRFGVLLSAFDGLNHHAKSILVHADASVGCEAESFSGPALLVCLQNVTE